MFKQAELQPEFLSRPAAAAFICRSVAWLRREERLGRGPALSRLGKSPIYPIEGLRRFMAERAEASK